ncbi:hypothetical protein HYX09_02810 [Candidatus Woesearchaeota archaeon]|nr:hypothetical protein [Candidatus Woesearchaeota archaeon]
MKTGKKAADFGIILILIIGLILGSALIFYITGSREVKTEIGAPEPAAEEIAEEQPLRITSAKLCNSLDEKYNCDENAEGEFAAGSAVNLYIRAVGFKANDGIISYSEDFELYDSKNNFMPEGSKKGIVSGELDVSALEQPFVVEIRNNLPTYQTDPKAEYTIRAILKDRNNAKQTAKTVKFKLK